MRKLLKQILLFVIIFVFLLLPSITITKPFHGMMLSVAKGYEDLYQMKQLRNIDLLHELVVIPRDVKEKESLRDMIIRISKIDRTVLELLVKHNVKVRLFEGDLTDEPLLYYLKWKKPRGWKNNVTWEEVPGSGGSWLISAKIGASKAGNGHGSVNLELHEIGHTVYNLLRNKPSFSQQFEQAWKQEVEILFPKDEYFIQYRSEYFAEAFAYYYYDADLLFMKDKSPLTYQVMKELGNYSK